MEKHIFWFMCRRGNENLKVIGEWAQKMTNYTDQNNHCLRFIVAALL